MTSRTPKGVPAGGEFAANEHDAAKTPLPERSASEVAQIDDDRFVGYENDLAVLRAELASNTDTYPASMNVEFSPETYWAPRRAGIRVIGYCDCADEESGHGIFQGDPKNINDWLDTHTKDHA